MISSRLQNHLHIIYPDKKRFVVFINISDMFLNALSVLNFLATLSTQCDDELVDWYTSYLIAKSGKTHESVKN